MAHGMKTVEAAAKRKARIFKALDYDPDLDNNAIAVRFGIANSTASSFKCEWRRKNEER